MWDVDTGLYYLRSRYYNYACGRFVNADGYETKYIKFMYIIGHGSPGTIDCNGEWLDADLSEGQQRNAYSFSQLKELEVAYMNLYTCNGATPNENGNTAAKAISARSSNSEVFSTFCAKIIYASKFIPLYRVDEKQIRKLGISKMLAGWEIQRADM